MEYVRVLDSNRMCHKEWMTERINCTACADNSHLLYYCISAGPG